MKFINYNNQLIVVFLLLVIFSCSNKDKSLTNKIYSETLYSVLDSLNNEHNIANKEIIIGRHETDELLSFIVEDTKDELEGDTIGPSRMILKLTSTLFDTVFIDVDMPSNKYNFTKGVTKKKLHIVKKINSSKNSNKVLLNLSKVIVFSTAEMGCFYISINSSKKTAGYVVFISKKKNKSWEIVSMLRKWG